ncbi:unnamed protein product [Ostreobium quekettii]|uniref:Uncharacterized protein n=1 Tax=Ostreobium quekettii TaxID=121088 RepID=A0A8S1J849_9CHLO|nr:unnamed protein product [Ostreobium quekettii]
MPIEWSQMELLSARAARLVGWAIGDGGHDNAALESSALLKTVRRVLPAAVQWLGWNWGHEVVIQDLLKRLKRASRPGAIVALRIMSTIIQTMARATQQDPSAKAACMSVCKALLGSGAAGQTARTVGVKQEIVQLVAGVLSTLAYVQKEVAGSGGESVLLADADLGECLKLLQAVARKLHPSSVPRSVMPMMAIGREGVNKQRKSEGRK